MRTDWLDELEALDMERERRRAQQLRQTEIVARDSKAIWRDLEEGFLNAAAQYQRRFPLNALEVQTSESTIEVTKQAYPKIRLHLDSLENNVDHIPFRLDEIPSAERMRTFASGQIEVSLSEGDEIELAVHSGKDTVNCGSPNDAAIYLLKQVVAFYHPDPDARRGRR